MSTPTPPPGRPPLPQDRTPTVVPGASSPEPLVEGLARIGRYQDRGLLGRGATADVHLVHDPRLRRDLALKVLRRDMLGDPRHRERFVDEARITAELQHPGVPPVHELGELPDGRPYLALQQVRGRTLATVADEVHAASTDRVWRRAPSGWTLRRLLAAFHRACETVAYAHSRGVVHRDLKPGNIMVGDFGEVHVIDWGLARSPGAVEPPAAADGMALGPGPTLDGEVAGTPAYMAPEQARAERRALLPATDVYALGAVLHHLLYQRSPMVEGSVAQTLDRLRRGERDLFGGSLPVPPALREICETALRLDPAARHEDAGALAAAVGAWLAGERRRDDALAVVARADALRAVLDEQREKARTLRRSGHDLLESLPARADVDQKRPGWDLLDAAGREEEQAAITEITLVQHLRAALTHDPDLDEAHARLADHYRGRHADAEAGQDLLAASRFAQLLADHDRAGRHARYLQGEGWLSLRTDPPGATVAASRYEQRGRRLVQVGRQLLGRTPIEGLALPSGSYLLELEAPGCDPVRYPVAIGRTGHWDGVAPGGRQPEAVRLPRAGELDAQDVFVAAGWFRAGAATNAQALPPQDVWLDSFVIRRHPVTNAEYMAFLDALVERGDEGEALRHVPQNPAAGSDRGTPFYGRDREGRFVLLADPEGDVWQPDWPVLCVSWYSAQAYARWWSEQTGRSWSLPDELRWEKAARGVDGRLRPWGEHLEPSWACMIDSHDGRPLPASVHDFSGDESPYGVRGLAGNVRDWCADPFRLRGPVVELGRPKPGPDTPDAPFRVARGGHWHLGEAGCTSLGRVALSPAAKLSSVGIRLVREV